MIVTETVAIMISILVNLSTDEEKKFIFLIGRFSILSAQPLFFSTSVDFI